MRNEVCGINGKDWERICREVHRAKPGCCDEGCPFVARNPRLTPPEKSDGRR